MADRKAIVVVAGRVQEIGAADNLLAGGVKAAASLSLEAAVSNNINLNWGGSTNATIADNGSFIILTCAAARVFKTDSPNLTGVPVAPTAAAGTNTTQLATTAFVLANASISGWPVNIDTVPAATTDIVATGYQLVVGSGFTVDGTLTLDGTLFVVG